MSGATIWKVRVVDSRSQVRTVRQRIRPSHLTRQVRPVCPNTGQCIYHSSPAKGEPCRYEEVAQAIEDALHQLGCPSVPRSVSDSTSRVRRQMPCLTVYRRSVTTQIAMQALTHTATGRRSSLRNSQGSAPTNLLTLPQTPTLTGFVGSLKAGKPFRVSVHCWEPPWSADSTLSLKTRHETVAYEVRVYLDGHLKVARLITQNSSFPEILGLSSGLFVSIQLTAGQISWPQSLTALQCHCAFLLSTKKSCSSQPGMRVTIGVESRL